MKCWLIQHFSQSVFNQGSSSIAMSNERDDKQEQDKAKRDARAAYIAKAVDKANPSASGDASAMGDSAENAASFSDAGTEYIEGYLREELGLDGDLTDDEFAMAALDFLGTPAKEGATMFFNPDELNKLAQKESGAATDADDFADIDAFAKSVEELEEAIALVSDADYGDEGTVMIPDLVEPETADEAEAIASTEQTVTENKAKVESTDIDQSTAEPLEEMVVVVEQDDSVAIANSDHQSDDTPAEELFEEAVSEISQESAAAPSQEIETQGEAEEELDDAFFELMEIQALLESDSSLREANSQNNLAVDDTVAEEIVEPEPEIEEAQAVEEISEPIVAESSIDEQPAEPLTEATELEPLIEEPVADLQQVEPEHSDAEMPIEVVEPDSIIEATEIVAEAPDLIELKPEAEAVVANLTPEPEVPAVELPVAEVEPPALIEESTPNPPIDTTAAVETLNFKVEDSENYLESIIAALDAEVSEVNLATTGIDSDGNLTLHDEDVEQMMVFAIGGTTYAMPMDNVLEISEPVAESSVPFVPTWVRGVINLRGEIISLVDLRVYLDSDGDVSRPAEWMIVAQTSDTSMLVGFIVDDVLGNRQFTPEQKVDITESTELASTKYLRCIYQREDQLILALEFNDLLRSSDMMQFQPV